MSKFFTSLTLLTGVFISHDIHRDFLKRGKNLCVGRHTVKTAKGSYGGFDGSIQGTQTEDNRLIYIKA
ncbi:MAG: hypothetical protein Q8L02_00310 [Candidatus Nitrotoga sp.]|nr:hypothetical protein [Candidatus Nitrotoga sp.]